MNRSIVLAVVSLGVSVPSAFAQTFTVNDTADVVDANAGDGLCETAAGVCTLRAAIQEANALAAAGVRIELAAGTYTLALPGSGEDAALTGDLDINTSLTIEGAGAAATIVDGAGLDRVLDVAPAPLTSFADVEVTLSGITVRGGSTEEGEHGGGIRYAGALVVRESTISNNVTGGSGGGLSYNPDDDETQLTLVDSVVADNQATSELVFGEGGGIFEYGSLTLTRSSVRGNEASSNGGGVYSGVDAVIVDSTFSENVSGAGGGGLDAGCLTVNNSLFSANTSVIGGGIKVNGGCDSTITNSTLSGNTAEFQGGGLFVASGGGSVTLTYVTVAQNEIVSTDIGAGGGGLFRASGFETKPARLQNTLLDSNARQNCAGNSFISLGNNLDSGASCALSEPGDLSNVDPLLGPLADNGGLTWTHALSQNSPAIDAAATIATISVDQRGFARPVDGDADGMAVSDIGAYERAAKTKKHHRHKLFHKLRRWFWRS